MEQKAREVNAATGGERERKIRGAGLYMRVGGGRAGRGVGPRSQRQRRVIMTEWKSKSGGRCHFDATPNGGKRKKEGEGEIECKWDQPRRFSRPLIRAHDQISPADSV